MKRSIIKKRSLRFEMQQKLVKTKDEQLKGVVQNKIKTLSSVVQKEVNFRKMLQVQ